MIEDWSVVAGLTFCFPLPLIYAHRQTDRQTDRQRWERQTDRQAAAKSWRRYGSISSGWSSSGTPRWASRVWSGGSRRAASPRCRTPQSAWTSSPGWWRSSPASGSSCRSGTRRVRSASGEDSWRSVCVCVCPLISVFYCMVSLVRNGEITHGHLWHLFGIGRLKPKYRKVTNIEHF